MISNKAPIRPYGFVTDFYGDSNKYVHRHYQYFEMDQSHVGGVIAYLNSGDSGQGVFTLICGRNPIPSKKLHAVELKSIQPLKLTLSPGSFKSLVIQATTKSLYLI